MTRSSIYSMRSRISFSCLLRTLIVLFLQQLSLHAIPTSGPLEELEEALEGSEDNWYIWWISWSLELLEDSLSEWSSSKSLNISSLLFWSVTRVLIRALAFYLHCSEMTSLPTVEAFSWCFGYRFTCGFGLSFLLSIILGCCLFPIGFFRGTFLFEFGFPFGDDRG